MKILMNHLQPDKELLHKYDHVIKQQAKAEIIEEVLYACETGTKKYYLSHHPVLTPDKEIRISYDASAKARSASRNLHECLYRGPVILPDLCGLYSRFQL